MLNTQLRRISQVLALSTVIFVGCSESGTQAGMSNLTAEQARQIMNAQLQEIQDRIESEDLQTYQNVEGIVQGVLDRFKVNREDWELYLAANEAFHEEYRANIQEAMNAFGDRVIEATLQFETTVDEIRRQAEAEATPEEAAGSEE